VEKERSLPRGVFEKVPGSGIFWIRYTDVQGRLRREKAGSLGTANKLLASRRTAKLQGKLPETGRPGKAILVSELIDDALRHAQAQDSAYHAHDLKLKLDRVRAAFGRRAAQSIRKSEIIDWLASEARKHHWKPASRNRYAAAISLVFRVAVEDEKLPFNPAAGIRRLREENQRTRFLSPDEEGKLTAVIRRRFPDYLPVFLLALHTGMRTSELLRARVGDYDRKTGKMLVRQKKVRNSPAFRYVPLTPIGVSSYQQPAGKRKAGGPLCRKMEGGRLEDTRYWFDPCVAEAGLVNCVWYTLRHTAASSWVMSGVPLAAVALFLGHQNISMTMRYSHLQPENDERAVAALMSFYGDRAGNETDTTTDTSTPGGFQQAAKSL